MFRWKQTCSTSITKMNVYISNIPTKHTHHEEDVMIAKSDIKMLWMKLSVFPPKCCTTPLWEILSKTEFPEFCNVKSEMTRARHEHVPTVPHYIAEGLIEGTWCRGIYVSLVDLTHNTPIFISSKQWWIGMCSVYLGRMICDDGWTLQWFTELFVGTLQ